MANTQPLKKMLKAHARRHRLALMDCGGLTSRNFEEAKELVCEAANNFVLFDGPNVDVSVGETGAELFVVVRTRRDSKPRLCKRCEALKDNIVLVNS